MNKEITLTIFREKATAALAGYHVGPLSWSNWNLQITVFMEGRKLENQEKNRQSKARTSNKLDPHTALGWS